MHGACGFFAWHNEPVPMRSKHVINDLVKKLNNLERETKSKKSKQNCIIIILVVLLILLIFLCFSLSLSVCSMQPRNILLD
jgi:amino acid permease